MTLVYRSLFIVTALIGWIFAYRLLSGGLTLQEGEVQFKVFKKFEAKAVKVTSGSVFFICGTGVLIMALLNPVTVRVRQPGQSGPGSVDIIATLDDDEVASRISGLATTLEQIRKGQEIAAKAGQQITGSIASLTTQVQEAKKEIGEVKQVTLGALVAPWVAAGGQDITKVKKGNVIRWAIQGEPTYIPTFKVYDPAALKEMAKKWDGFYTKNLGLEPVKTPSKQ